MTESNGLYENLKSGNILYILESLIDSYNDNNINSILSAGTGGGWEIPPDDLIQVVSGYYTESDKKDILCSLDKQINDYKTMADLSNDAQSNMYQIYIRRTELVKSIIEICFIINKAGKLSAPEKIRNVDDRIALSNACYILSVLAFGG